MLRYEPVPAEFPSWYNSHILIPGPFIRNPQPSTSVTARSVDSNWSLGMVSAQDEAELQGHLAHKKHSPPRTLQ